MKARGANCAGTDHETSTTTNATLENEKEENFDTGFNSFGSSSNCDEDDTQSNILLEEYVGGLNQKIFQKIAQLVQAKSQVDMAIFCSKIKRESQRLEREKTLGIENYAMRSAPQIMMPLV